MKFHSQQNEIYTLNAVWFTSTLLNRKHVFFSASIHDCSFVVLNGVSIA
jgi:hypothetical protein